ncbi:MAG: septation protein A [Alphaproteobacteria bacterium]
MEFERAPNTPSRAEINPFLKLALEMGPLVLFFLANARGEKLAESWPLIASFGKPIFFATAVFVVAIVTSLVVSYSLTRRLPLMPFVTAIIVVVFGGLTLWLQNETFIKIKPTIIYLLFGSLLLGGLAMGKLFLGYVFDAVFKLTDEGWRRLTVRWGVFFLVLAVLNEIVWRSYSTDVWVSFKLFGFLPLTFVFAMAQMRLISRYSPEEDDKEDAPAA